MSSEQTQAQLKDIIVNYLIKNDKEFHAAVMETVGAEIDSSDSRLHRMFREKSPLVLKKVFGFRTRGSKPKPKPKRAKQPTKVEAKPVTIPAPAKIPAPHLDKPRPKANKMTHEKAIVALLQSKSQPLSRAEIKAGLQKMNHHIVDGRLSSSLWRLKTKSIIKSILKTSGDKRGRYNYVV
jgi:hypothetical protein